MCMMTALVRDRQGSLAASCPSHLASSTSAGLLQYAQQAISAIYSDLGLRAFFYGPTLIQAGRFDYLRFVRRIASLQRSAC